MLFICSLLLQYLEVWLYETYLFLKCSKKVGAESSYRDEWGYIMPISLLSACDNLDLHHLSKIKQEVCSCRRI